MDQQTDRFGSRRVQERHPGSDRVAQCCEKHLDNPLAPDPESVLLCLIDLGLSDDEIARYFDLDPELITLYAAPLRKNLAA